MESRSTESPMDFEYQDKVGPADAASPFLRFASQQSRKRPYGAFESPSKPSNFNTNGVSAPLFSTPKSSVSQQKTLPSMPLYTNPAFTTPRTLDVALDSSDIDQTSPENNAECEATPEMGFQSQMANVSSALAAYQDRNAEKKFKPFYERAGPHQGKFGVSKAFPNTFEKRKLKRRRDSGRRFTFWRRRSDSSSENDRETMPFEHGRENQASSGSVVSFFGFINTHPDLPHILSFYVQLLLNIFLVGFFIYLIYSFWSTIRADIDKKSEEAAADVMAEMAVCLKQYNDNRCDDTARAPALDSLCENWKRCMSRDPKALGRARVSAHTFAEIFNSFIEPISYKAMIFSILVAFACFGTCNMAFGLFRTKSQAMLSTSPQFPTPYSKHRTNGAVPDVFHWTHQDVMRSQKALHINPSAGQLRINSPRRKLEF